MLTGPVGKAASLTEEPSAPLNSKSCFHIDHLHGAWVWECCFNLGTMSAGSNAMAKDLVAASHDCYTSARVLMPDLGLNEHATAPKVPQTSSADAIVARAK